MLSPSIYKILIFKILKIYKKKNSIETFTLYFRHSKNSPRAIRRLPLQCRLFQVHFGCSYNGEEIFRCSRNIPPSHILSITLLHLCYLISSVIGHKISIFTLTSPRLFKEIYSKLNLESF